MGLIDAYNYFTWESADSRTNDWFLIGSPWPLMVILSSYTYFVLQFGPKYMEKKEAYSLKSLINFYNSFQIVMNSLMVYSIIKFEWNVDNPIGCRTVDYSMDATAIEVAKVVYATFLLKVFDLIETIMFVLRKKNNQISFLHVYHHLSIILIAWASSKWFAGGMITIPILVNSSVHVIMYTYYYLSSQGGTWQQIVNPVKPFITIIQMVQFIILILHAAQAFLPNCKSSKILYSFHILNLMMNFCLFYNFYRKNNARLKKH